MRRTNDFKSDKPTDAVVKKYLEKWNKKVPYIQREESLEKLYKIFTKNNNMAEVLAKVSTLNDFYSTNIMSVYDVAKKIVACKNFDNRIKMLDCTLIDEISNVEINGKKRCFYSFATKYCSHHNSNDYPIFDKNVQRILWEFNKKDEFTTYFSLKSLKNYEKFCYVITAFKTHYGLTCSLKELDIYLWQVGKEYFELIKKEK